MRITNIAHVVFTVCLAFGIDQQAHAASPSSPADCDEANRPVASARPVQPDRLRDVPTVTEFLAANTRRSGVTTTASGLQYRVTRSGPATGARPTATSVVKANVEARFLDGQFIEGSFETCDAKEIALSETIPVLREAFQLMRPGDEWTIWLPLTLGYKNSGASGRMSQNTLMVYRFRFEEIVR